MIFLSTGQAVGWCPSVSLALFDCFSLRRHVGDDVIRPANSAGGARYANQDPLIRLYCFIQSPLKTQLGVRSFYVEHNNNNNNNNDDDDDGLITFLRVCHRSHAFLSLVLCRFQLI